MTVTVTRPVPTTVPAQRRSRRRLPVGARFPRRTVEAQLAYAGTEDAPTPAPAPLFPVGARFPRRSDADVVAYLSDHEILATPRPARDARPVGARFPRLTD